MSLAQARAVDRARKLVGRVAGPLFAPRHGRLFVARRTVATALQQATRAGEIPEGFHNISFAEAAAMAGRPLVHPEPGYPVLDLRDGVLVTPWGHAGPDDHHYVYDLTFQRRTRTDETHLAECELATRGPLTELAGRSASLIQNFFDNYCHWLLQGIVRFDVLERAGGFERYDRLLLPPRAPDVVYEAAASYGLGRDRFLQLPEEPGVVRCEELTIAGLPRLASDVPPWAIDVVRERFGRFGEPDAPRRIHLTRGGASRRRVVNNDEVTALLHRRGFVDVSMDGRTLAQQAELMGNAECVVAPHGAAMANIVFMPRESLVVELRYRNWPTDMYAGVAASTGLRYRSLFGTEPATPRWLGVPKQIDADTVVDVRGLARVLDDEGIT